MIKQVVADESVDFGLIRKLRASGFKVISISEDFSGIDDPEVLDIAVQKQMILITEDKDFGELTYRLQKEHFGIFLLRLSDLPRSIRLEFAFDMIFNHFDELHKNFSVLTKHGLRIKRTVNP